MNSPKPLRPIHVRAGDVVGETPFAGDAFNRVALAERLTAYLDRLKDGCVVAIDAPWGEGKTWFGRNWKAQLDAGGFKTIYVDAFERDYLEDPFTLLSSEILASFDASAEDPVGKSLLDASLKLGKALLPAAAKISVNTLGRILFGTPDITGDAAELAKKIDEKISDATERYVASRIAEAESEKNAVQAFRTALTEFAAKQERPVVFFVDELDRCRPDFAVRIIERVKHFFDVPNLVFVLLLNREQLERAVQGTYGQSFNAHAYLGKFVHLYFTLPKQVDRDAGRSNAAWTYSWAVAERYRFEKSRDLDIFIKAFSPLASAASLSLRDIEKSFALLAMADQNASMHYLAWPIVLKLKHPGLVPRLASGDANAHMEAHKALSELGFRNGELWICDYFSALHLSVATGRDALNEDQKQALERYKPAYFFHSVESLIPAWLRMIDVAVEL